MFECVAKRGLEKSQLQIKSTIERWEALKIRHRKVSEYLRLHKLQSFLLIGEQEEVAIPSHE